MKKTKKIILLLVGTPVIFCSLFVWALNSPTVDDYYWLYRRDTESHLAVAFAVALRMNHKAAYEMIDPALKPRLDEWMNTHKAPKCARRRNDILSGGFVGHTVYYDCHTVDNRWYRFNVHNIIIEGMKVVDWGEVIERYD